MRELILDRFARYADRPFLIPDGPADAALSYGAMGRMTSRALRVLRNSRIQRGDYVALALRNSPELVALLFAALVSGVRVVLLGPSFTVEEAAGLHRDLAQRGLFVDGDNFPVQAGTVLPSDLPCFAIGRGTFSPESGDLSALDAERGPPIDPRGVACILCSSGSTGKPKRICISSRNMLAELESMIRAHGLADTDRHLCVLPLYHASGLFRNILMPFCQGGSAVLCESFDQRRFWELVAAHRIAFVQVVPSILALLLNQDLDPPQGVRAHLKYLGSASAPLTLRLLENFEKRFAIPVLQAYGLTETTCGITLSDTAPERRRLGSVGRPLDVNEVKILGADGGALPARQTGEVVVRGDNVMEGYLGSEALPDSPCLDGWFHTGDLGYADEDGYLYLTGRKSDIVNRGAHKISPLEVEEVMRRHPQVRDVLVCAVPHEILGEDLVACVVRAGEIEGKELLYFAARHLPSYKVPSAVRFVEQIPWSASGKINRKSFAASLAAQSDEAGQASEHVAAAGSDQAGILGIGAGASRSSLARGVIRLVAEVFDVDAAELSLKSGPHDVDEWDSMGHIRLMMATEEAYAVSFSVADNASVHSIEDLLALLSIQLAARTHARADPHPGEAQSL